MDVVIATLGWVALGVLVLAVIGSADRDRVWLTPRRLVAPAVASLLHLILVATILGIDSTVSVIITASLAGVVGGIGLAATARLHPHHSAALPAHRHCPRSCGLWRR